jgi:hypothetical protein
LMRCRRCALPVQYSWATVSGGPASRCVALPRRVEDSTLPTASTSLVWALGLVRETASLGPRALSHCARFAQCGIRIFSPTLAAVTLRWASGCAVALFKPGRVRTNLRKPFNRRHLPAIRIFRNRMRVDATVGRNRTSKSRSRRPGALGVKCNPMSPVPRSALSFPKPADYRKIPGASQRRGKSSEPQGSYGTQGSPAR